MIVVDPRYWYPGTKISEPRSRKRLWMKLEFENPVYLQGLGRSIGSVVGVSAQQTPFSLTRTIDSLVPAGQLIDRSKRQRFYSS